MSSKFYLFLQFQHKTRSNFHMKKKRLYIHLKGHTDIMNKRQNPALNPSRNESWKKRLVPFIHIYLRARPSVKWNIYPRSGRMIYSRCFGRARDGCENLIPRPGVMSGSVYRATRSVKWEFSKCEEKPALEIITRDGPPINPFKRDYRSFLFGLCLPSRGETTKGLESRAFPWAEADALIEGSEKSPRDKLSASLLFFFFPSFSSSSAIFPHSQTPFITPEIIMQINPSIVEILRRVGANLARAVKWLQRGIETANGSVTFTIALVNFGGWNFTSEGPSFADRRFYRALRHKGLSDSWNGRMSPLAVSRTRALGGGRKTWLVNSRGHLYDAEKVTRGYLRRCKRCGGWVD